MSSGADRPILGKLRDRVARPSRARVLSGALAAIAALGFGYFAAREFETPYLATLAIDASSSVLSPGGLSQVMEIVGELGKAATFSGVLALQFAVYVLVWAVVRANASTTLRAYAAEIAARVGIAAVIFLALAGFFALAADTPPLTGWEWGELALVTAIEATAFAVFAFALQRALPALPDVLTTLRAMRRPEPAPVIDEASSAGPVAVLSRRQFMRVAWVMGAGTASIAAAWYLGKGVAATARTGVVRALDGLWSEEVTPTEDFYVVSKNLNGFEPSIDAAGWSLKVDGMVREELSLTLDDLQAMPVTTNYNTLMCISYRVGGKLISNASWTGVRLRDVLERAGVDTAAGFIKFSSADDYEESLPLEAALDEDVRLVWLMNGQPLTRKHGFPLRALVPGRYGMKNPKWITRISVEPDEAEGYWAARGWSRTAFVQTMSRFDVPGRNSRIPAGLSPLRGVAFAGERGITRVEVSVDGGESWDDALVHPPLSDFTWVRWEYDFEAVPSRQVLLVRATDGTGRQQIEEARDPLPEGATGFHRRPVRVTEQQLPVAEPTESDQA